MSFDLKIQDGDLQIASNGDVRTVGGTEKLVQDVLKIIFTPLGSNRYHPFYGCPLTQAMIGKAFDTVFVSSVATAQLSQSLQRLRALQGEQLAQNQEVTPQEQIAAIQNVSVGRNSVDPRFYTIAVTVLSKSFNRVRVPIDVRL